jgi:hypothetical protein
VAGVVSVPASASATLIGDRIDFTRNGGPPIPGLTIFDDVVQELVVPEIEFVDGNGFGVDIRDASIAIVNNTTVPNLNYNFSQGTDWVWSDLEWVGENGQIVGLSFSTSGNVSNPENFILTLVDGHTVQMTVTDQTGPSIFPGNEYVIQLEVEHVPEPATALLLACGLVGLGAARRRRWVN